VDGPWGDAVRYLPCVFCGLDVEAPPFVSVPPMCEPGTGCRKREQARRAARAVQELEENRYLLSLYGGKARRA